jgi:hypothetical protein
VPTDELILFSDVFGVERCAPPDLSRVPKLCVVDEPIETPIALQRPL